MKIRMASWLLPFAMLLGIVALAAATTGTLAAQNTPTPTAVAPTSTSPAATNTLAPDTPTPAPTQPTTSTPVASLPDLTVSIFDSPDTVPIGAPITYIVTVRNDGLMASPPTTLVDRIPLGATVDNLGPDCGVVAGAITCGVPPLAAGQSAAFTFSMNAAPEPGGAMVNTVTVDPGNLVAESNEGNNSATATTTVLPFGGPPGPIPPQGLPDLRVSASSPVSSVSPGWTLSYSVTVVNDGGAPSPPTTLVSALPPGTTLNAAVAGCQLTDVTVSCEVPSLLPGASMGFDFTLDVGAASGPITATVTVDAGNLVAESDEANNTAAVSANVVAPAPAPAAPAPAPVPPGAELWLHILAPTQAYSVDMDPLWTASPGEWYWVTGTDSGWALAVWEGDTTGWSVWIQMDGRVESVIQDLPVPAAPSGVWLVVESPTEAYADNGQMLWTASPGEWYRVIRQDQGWALVVYESDPPSATVWIPVDGRVELGPTDAPHSTQ